MVKPDSLRHVYHLAELEMGEAEEEMLRKKYSGVLEYAKKILDVECGETEFTGYEGKPPLRDDVLSETTMVLSKNTGNVEEDFFVIDPILGE